MQRMGYQALLFCPEEKTARIVTQVLNELEFSVELCSEPFAAVKKLMAQHFDALVVDCDNEQNAILLFKGARNSGLNQNSLMVAIVEGQTGVAKAFRIGANLVLTKPINVEQSKGTLRVARGLLRKGEAAKPAGQASGGHAAAVAPFNPTLAASSSAQSGIPAPAASTSAFELDAEPAPQPDAAEAALLEYMPDSVTSAGAPAIRHDDQLEDSSSMSKQYPWQPVSKPLGEPMASALRRAAEAAGQSDSAFNPAGGGQATQSSGGAAAAPAPAKQTSRAAVTSIASPIAAAAISVIKPLEPEVSIESPTGSASETPMFSGLSESAAKDGSSAGGSRKFLLVAILVLAAAAGYLAWSRLQSGSGQPASPKAMTQSPSSSTLPALQSQEETAAAPSAEVTPQSGTAVTVEPDIVITRTPIQQPAQVQAETGNGSSSKPSAGVTSTPAPKDVTKEPLPAKEDEAIVVASSPAPAPKATPAVEETAEAPAPATLVADSGADAKTLSKIVSASTPGLPKQTPATVKISKGVSEGLVVKRVSPVYPPHALQVRLQGSVELQASIGKDGSIVAVRQISGDPVLGKAAMDAVRQWKYKPYYLDGEPVEVQTQITVNFKLP